MNIVRCFLRQPIQGFSFKTNGKLFCVEHSSVRSTLVLSAAELVKRDPRTVHTAHYMRLGVWCKHHGMRRH